ncbi:hypothetical protein NFHSH190041_20740 [Shewanella sp. NFH-SH190041]|uniref:DUF413 domain-containing protein n=1 Tax=Shewanella sp. NFH-SH190041 TaxID=2950245 RepID=UPI0021FDD3F3|nr:hypothetical protein NFHSH190041_20740 [Shewanella sp. NFH-SH190041]
MAGPELTDLAGMEQHTSAQGGFISYKRFYDDTHFPRGFSRCGDFTTKEAQLLEQHGHAMQALARAERVPVTVEETQFVEVLSGQRAAETLLERIWLKYCKLCAGKPFYSVSNSPRGLGSHTILYDPDDAPY